MESKNHDINADKANTFQTKSFIKLNFNDILNEKTCSYNEDYKLGGVLGFGVFAEIRKVTNRKTKIVRAMRIIDKKKINNNLEDKIKLMSEIQILKQFDHPNILKSYEFYQDARNYYQIIELCTGGELFDKIIEQGSISEKEASYIMKQLLCAVLYAHNHGIVHRDLKPENILLDISPEGGYNIKVIDWGTAKQYNDKNEKMTEKCGTPYYVAPEVLRKEYDEKCDIWSCGAILYILLSGKPPFPGRNDGEILKNVAKGIYIFDTDEWKDISDDAKEFISKMLCYDPKKRLSAAEALKDRWFDQVNTYEKLNKYDFTKNLKNLRNFRTEQKLQQAAFAFIANHLASKEEREQLMSIFKLLDKNGDGSLSKEEIMQGYKQIIGEDGNEAEVNKIIEFADIDKSGEIDYTEFIAAALDKKQFTSKEKLIKAFNLFDTNSNGLIEVNELKEVLGIQLKDIDEASWNEMVKEVDANGDGVISFSEFCNMMIKFVKQ